MVNRKQADFARLKVQGWIWPCIANGRNLRTPASGVAAAHDRNPPLAMFRRRIINDQRPLRADTFRSWASRTRRMCPIAT